MPKYFILNAENFGQSNESNRAVLDGYNNGFLTSAGVCVNGKAIESALNEILPECPNLSIGINLNITSGKALTKNKLLSDRSNIFSNGFFKVALKSFDKDFLNEAETEFRCQIETLLQHSKIDFISSKDNIHLIPELYNLVSKLAEEYDVKFINTKYELLYYAPNFLKHFNMHYPLNILKTITNNYLSTNIHNRNTVCANDLYIGNLYHSMINKNVILRGLEVIDKEDNCVVEAGISPCVYKNSKRKTGVKEFLLTLDKEFLDSVQRMGFEVTNYRKLKR